MFPVKRDVRLTESQLKGVKNQLLASVLTSFLSYRGIREERVVCIHIFVRVLILLSFVSLFLGIVSENEGEI